MSVVGLMRQGRLFPSVNSSGKFLLTRWNKIHLVNCKAIPDDLEKNYEPIDSFATGVARGGRACGVCLSEFYEPLADQGITPAN